MIGMGLVRDNSRKGLKKHSVTQFYLNTAIGAGAVAFVTKLIPANCTAVGMPAESI